MTQSKKDLLATLLTQTWKLVSGPLIMLLIPLFLTESQQGYWYLFVSISALSIFADLGFSNIILQFSAHEYAFLKINKEGLLEGKEENLLKLASFFRFTLKWIVTICAVVFPIIFIIGILFFIRDNVLSIYLLPWCIYSIGSLLIFFNNSILSFLEGLDNIAEIQKIRFYVSILNTIVVTVLLISHANIYALACGIFISSSSIFISLFGKFKKIIYQLFSLSREYAYSWFKQIFPLFLRYAISFSSGYFIFQIYTPLMHYFHGSIYSGKVGITLSLVTAIFTMANTWLYTITPKINMLISKKDWKTLDRLFLKRLVLSVISYLLIGFFCIIFILVFNKNIIVHKVIERFLPLQSIIILYICYLIQIVINGMALYLRGHKQEPYMLMSLIAAFWIFITTLLIGKYLSPDLFFLGFLSFQILSFPFAFYIFRVNRIRWHEEHEQ